MRTFINTFIAILYINLAFCQKVIYNVNNGTEEGFAKYYSEKNPLSNNSINEVYPDTLLTASHPRYPLNTIVNVYNLENNTSTLVRINNHCNCDNGTIIILSKEAAMKLSMISSGKAKVRLEPISNSDYEMINRISNINIESEQARIHKTLKSNLQANRTYNIFGEEKFPKGYAFQIGVFSNTDRIKDLLDELKNMNIRNNEIYLQVVVVNNTKIHRILIREFNSKIDADEYLKKMQKLGCIGIIGEHL